MTEQDYLLAWAVYGVAALAALAVGFRMTGWMWRALREPLRVIMAVLLFTPTLVDPLRDLYAPAIAISALDLLFDTGSNVWRAVTDLATFGMAAFVLYFVFVAIRWPLQRRRRARQAAAEAAREPTLAEVLAQQGGGERREPRL
ncbi:MFS transporter [Pseudomonas sp. OF001]|jgi:predicted membrane protein|uniref:MFS transporter n=1 Tax=unclassified Pseudomonas TaxID=196821 RepID=UPI0010A5EAC6|nr:MULTISPECIES: MFS transporter [unclassified Pseudomonas]THG86099.1 MFS transporter [Pseudomonas sp. A-1]WPP45907.1 MFS transporter [Pseudomonas sp. AN-1]CAD5377242.1 MFS transporter [Pseudomonas sp. OF001]